MRTSERIVGAGLLCLALAACDRAPGDVSATPSGKLVDCAIGAGSPWRRDCAVDQQRDILTLRHADGGFRRLHIEADGRGVTAADGAEQAVITVIGKDRIEISVGDDRYRIPATIAAAR